MTTTNKNLAIVIATKNNMRTIRETLDSVQGLGDYLLVVDSGSSDGTIELCWSKGAQVIHRDWPGMVRQRQFCLDSCSDYRWVLVLDSDESIDATLHRAIKQATQQDNPDIDAYLFNRKVWFMDGWLHHVFQPEYRLRLVRGKVAHVEGIGPEGKGGHDRIVVPGKTGFLPGTCKHDSWEGPGDMMRRYVELGSRAALYDPKKSTRFKIFTSPLAAFVKQYIFKKGFLDGRRGFVAAMGCSAGTLIKHLLKFSRSNHVEALPALQAAKSKGTA